MTRCLLPLFWVSVAQAGSIKAGDATPALQQKGAAAGWAVRETSLGPTGDKLAVSRDRRHVARVVRRGDKEVVLRDRIESREYESVWHDPYGTYLRFSPDSRRLAYTAKREGRWRLVVDGQEVATVKAGVKVGFTRDGKSWVARAEKAILVDGLPQPLERFPACVSEDGVHFGFIQRNGQRVELVVRGPQGKESRHDVGPRRTSKYTYDCPFDPYSYCGFSPDGQRVAYSVTLRGVDGVAMLFGREPSCRLMMDDVPVGEGQQLKWPVFSPDSTRLAFPVKRSGKWYVVVDGREEGAYDDIDGGLDALGRKRELFFSPDGKRLGYSAKKEGQWFAVVDGALGEAFAKLGRPVFSPDSSRVAYRAKRQEKWLVVVDGRPGKLYDDIEKEAVSDWPWREEVLFSPDGTRIAYRAKREGRWFAVVDGQEGPAYEEVAPVVFGPDGQHFAYVARRKDKWALVVDGVEGGEYDFPTERGVIFPTERGVLFDGPRQFHTIIQRGGEYLLLEVEILVS